jgi:hypothetical protein
VISATQGTLPDNTLHSQETDIYATGGIRTHNPSNEQSQTQSLDRAATGIGLAIRIHGRVFSLFIYLGLKLKYVGEINNSRR